MTNSAPLSLRKNIWRQISARLKSWKSDINQMFAARKGVDSVEFSICFIALAAKLAKADGQVTRDEVTMFRSVFRIPAEEEANAGRVFNLCRESTAGFEAYAKRMYAALKDDAFGSQISVDVLDGLFHIAMADGEYHENEETFLKVVAAALHLSEADFCALEARHVPDKFDPWTVLEMDRTDDIEAVKRTWRALVRDNHPDLMVARGLPEDMIELATSRLQAINKAYELIKASLETVLEPA